MSVVEATAQQMEEGQKIIVPLSYKVLNAQLNSGAITMKQFTEECNEFLSVLLDYCNKKDIPRYRAVCMLDTLVAGIGVKIVQEQEEGRANVQ